MTELHRRAKELIAAAADGDGPTAAERSRLRASLVAELGAGLVVGSATTAAAATKVVATAAQGSTLAAGASPAEVGAVGLSAAGHATLTAVAGKVLTVAALAVGLGGTGYALTSHYMAAPAVTSVTHQALRTSSAAPAGSEPASPAVGVAAKSVPATAQRAAADRPLAVLGPVETRGSNPPPRPSQGSVAAESFEAETEALRSAIAMLRDGRAAQAIAALDAQSALYAGGALGEEREVARIEALCALGRADDAREAGTSFLSAHPRSILAARVRASCAASR